MRTSKNENACGENRQLEDDDEYDVHADDADRDRNERRFENQLYRAVHQFGRGPESPSAVPTAATTSRPTAAAKRDTSEVMAASSIANIVKSSLGLVGLDKMVVDDTGDVTIINDGATILRLLEVEHPTAKVLCELAQLQAEEVGDYVDGHHGRRAAEERQRLVRQKMVVQVLITDPEKLEGIHARELDITKEKIEKILATGGNVVLCNTWKTFSTILQQRMVL